MKLRISFGKDLFTALVLIMVALYFAMTAVVETVMNEANLGRQLEKQYINASPSDVIGTVTQFQGSASSPYTLIEFGDYQCPPCHFWFNQIPGAMQAYRGRVRFGFRNYPLTAIHPYAEQAAVAAELARKQGMFWPVHDELYSLSSFDSAAIIHVIHSNNLWAAYGDKRRRQAAAADVSVDVTEARKLKLEETPTFLLCTPGHKVIKLSGLNQLPQFVK
jgi:protein-disulfide isomerase